MSNVKSIRVAIAAPLAVLLGLLGTAQVQAQVLEEVMVTAQKREQNLQDVGISVTSYSGEQMKALGVTNTVEITEQVPGLQMVTFSPNLTIFNIRGVSQNNFTDNLEAPVAVYIDDVYMASMNGINAQLFDVDRVEVLRGPQGTLFGRNATGGVIHYLTNGANDDELNGYVEATEGDFGRRNVEFAIGGGLSDNLRGRIAMRTEDLDGYMKSKTYPANLRDQQYRAAHNPPPPSGVDIGGANGWAARAELQYDINEAFTLTAQYKYTEDDGVPTGGYSFLPYADATNAYIPPEVQAYAKANIPDAANLSGTALEDFARAALFCPDQFECFTPVDRAGRSIYEGDHANPHEHYSSYPGYMDRETNSYTLKLDGELNNGMELVSISNYFDLDKFYTEDGDGIPTSIIEFTTEADVSQFSQEIRLSGETDQSRWVAGLYYLDFEIDADVLTRGAPAAGTGSGVIMNNADYAGGSFTNPGVYQDYTLESRNWSIFGQGEWDINEDMTFILGLRWSQDDKEMDFATMLRAPFTAANGDMRDAEVNLGSLADKIREVNSDTDTTNNVDSNLDEVDYGDWAGRLQLDWRVNEGILAYISYNRGIKGGNYAPSADALDNVGDFRHDEEVLHAYEIGVKTEFAGGLARINASAFYYDYEDYQSFTFSGGLPSVANAEAENMGLEVELIYNPTPNWDLLLGASFQDSEANDIETPQDQFVGPIATQVSWPTRSLDGNELPNTPTYSFNYLARYNMDLPVGGNIAFQLDGAFYDDQYLEVSNAAGTLQEAYDVHNARLTWTSVNESVRVSAWIKNLADEEYKNYALDLGVLGATVTYAPPRMYGLSASFRF